MEVERFINVKVVESVLKKGMELEAVVGTKVVVSEKESPNLFLQSCTGVGVRAGRGGYKLDFRFFLYCSARQHPAQNASTQRHGQPAPTDIWEVPAAYSLFAGTVPAFNLFLILLHNKWKWKKKYGKEMHSHIISPCTMSCKGNSWSGFTPMSSPLIPKAIIVTRWGYIDLPELSLNFFLPDAAQATSRSRKCGKNQPGNVWHKSAGHYMKHKSGQNYMDYKIGTNKGHKHAFFIQNID